MAESTSEFHIRQTKSGRFYFVLEAINGETVAMSEMYESAAAAEKGIASIQAGAAGAEIVYDYEV
jgi:hypothetical protein